jgi:hypothetical protein
MLMQYLTEGTASFLRDVVLLLIGGTVTAIPGAWKSWKRDRDKIVRDELSKEAAAKALKEELLARARLEVKVQQLTDDLDGIAAGMRTRFKVLEAIFEERTGKMPKAQRDSGEQAEINNERRSVPR